MSSTANLAAIAIALAVAISGCDRTKAPEPRQQQQVPSTAASSASTPMSTGSTSSAPAFDAGSLAAPQVSPKRVVAIGDLHGDLAATRKVLRLGGVIDANDAWIGGDLVVVQTGDQIDRGDDDRKILDLFDRLREAAEKSGGRVLSLLGNHEIMNATFDFRYVTPGAFTEFRDVNANVPRVDGLEPSQRGRAAAFAPGGPYASTLAKRPVVARVGDSIFVHGGVLPKHVRYGLDRINDEARSYLEGKQGAPSTPPPRILTSEDAPLWTRMYSAAPGREECAILDETLRLLDAKRMVVGHTPQKPSIAPACNSKVWRIDVGLSQFYGGPIQALEIKGDEVRVLAEEKPRP